MTGEPSDPRDPGINFSWRSLNLWTDTQMEANNRSHCLKGKHWSELSALVWQREPEWKKNNKNKHKDWLESNTSSPIAPSSSSSSSSVGLMRGKLPYSSVWVTLIIRGIFGFYSAAAMQCTWSSLCLTGRHKKWEGGKVGLQSVIHIIPLQRLGWRRPRAKHFDVDNDVGLCCHLM